MSFLCCLTMSLLGPVYWNESVAPEPNAAEKCMTKPICCSFKDVSLQEACEWFQYLMRVNINIDDDAVQQHRRPDQ